MFLRVTDVKHDDEIIINTKSIVCIHEKAQTVLLNGIHGEATGLYRISKQDMIKILSLINIIN